MIWAVDPWDHFSLLQATMLSCPLFPVGSRKMRDGVNKSVKSLIAKHVCLWILNKAIKVLWGAESSSWGHLLARHHKCQQCTPCPLGLRSKPLPHNHTGTTQKRSKVSCEQKPVELNSIVLWKRELKHTQFLLPWREVLNFFSNLSHINCFSFSSQFQRWYTSSACRWSKTKSYLNEF